MKLRLFTLLTTTILFLNLNAQKQYNNWVFGDGAAVSWNSGAPVAFAGTVLAAQEGVASISDANGNLLFYTDGTTVYTSTNVAMPNGGGLFGGFGTGSTQAALIVPVPGSSTLYYVFTHGATMTNLVYSQVDMSLNGGLGDVNGTKNVLLLANTDERLTAVHHANTTDYWVVTRLNGQAQFYAYQLSSSGINLIPVVSNIGRADISGVGYLTFSPDSKKVYLGQDYAQDNFGVPGWGSFFDFDNSTGLLSNFFIDTTYNKFGPYGSAFSPDSRYLYVAEESNDTTPLYQYDMQAGSEAAILASRLLIAAVVGGQDYFGALQPAVDDKIYIANYQYAFLHVINNPTVGGLGCNLVQQAVPLTGTCQLGLPLTIIHGTGFNYLHTCLGDSTLFTLALTVDSAHWDFGDPTTGAADTSSLLNPFHIFSAADTFSVTLISFKGGIADTAVQQVIIYQAPVVNLGPDTTLCSGQTLQLNAANSGDTYTWQDNSVAQTFTVNQAGNYWVNVANGSCIASDTVLVNYLNVNVSLGNDTTICSNTNYSINAFNAGSTYVWQDGSTASSYPVTQSGTYSVTVSIANCSATGTVTVTVNQVPVVNLGPDTTLCNGQILTLNAGNAGDTYHWSNGSNSQAITIFQTGNYWVNVSNGTCSAADTIQVNLGNNLSVNLGADTSVCAPNTVVLNPNISGATYVWQNGSLGSSFTVTQGGIYSVTATVGGCSGSDSVQISISPAPVVTATAQPATICPTDSAHLCASSGFVHYYWNFGDTSQCTYTSFTGSYYVTVTDANGCSAASNHATVTVYPSPPTSISENGDTLEVYGAASVQWYLNGNAINGATNNIYIATQAGNYTVQVTDTNGCTATSSKVDITGINNIGKDNIEVYPNPLSSGNWQLKVSSGLIGRTAEIFDDNGRLVYRSEIRSLKSEIELNAARGIYLLRINAGDGAYIKKLVKM